MEEKEEEEEELALRQRLCVHYGSGSVCTSNPTASFTLISLFCILFFLARHVFCMSLNIWCLVTTTGVDQHQLPRPRRPLQVLPRRYVTRMPRSTRIHSGACARGHATCCSHGMLPAPHEDRLRGAQTVVQGAGYMRHAAMTACRHDSMYP